jgi:hypothetical protein
MTNWQTLKVIVLFDGELVDAWIINVCKHAQFEANETLE